VSRIEVLHRHLYRDLEEKDIDMPVFSFSTSDILAVIHKHELLQKHGDDKVKRGLAADLQAFSTKAVRKAKRQRRAEASQHSG
jgi:hypothetical protein